jgi:hypothetical protein
VTRSRGALGLPSTPLGTNIGTGASCGEGSSSGEGSCWSGTMYTSVEAYSLLKLTSRIQMVGPGLATRGSAPLRCSSRLISSSPVAGCHSWP